MAVSKITEKQITDNGVVSAADVLTGSIPENKSVFDKLPRFIITVLNGLIDKFNDSESSKITDVRVNGVSKVTNNIANITVDSDVSDASENPISNKAAKSYADNLKWASANVAVDDALSGTSANPVQNKVVTNMFTSVSATANLAVQMIAPNNKVILDKAELPSVMVYIPKFKLSEVLNTENDSTHPAFIVNGAEIDGFYCSKYINCTHAGLAYSLPAQNPQAAINFDNSRARCEAKGNGWHLMTAAEWAAIALWCKKNGFMPYGNNNYGKDTRESSYIAIPSTMDAQGNTQRTATGTGPVEWYHDKTLGGIADLNGNVFEWQGGIRIVWGELQILENNNAADSDNPQNDTSECWKAIDAATGALVTPESKITDAGPQQSGSTVKFDWLNSKWTYSTGVSNATGAQSCTFANVTCTAAIGDAAKLLLRALGMLPDEGSVAADCQDDYFYMANNHAERCVVRGGAWYYGGDAGLFCSIDSYGRTNTGDDIGFRSAYCV